MRRKCVIALSRADDRGGVQVFVEALANALQAEQEVTVLIGRRGALTIDLDRVRVVSLSARNDAHILLSMLRSNARRLIADADVVVTNSTAMSAGVVAIARWYRTKSIFIAHGLASRYQPVIARLLVATLERLTVWLSTAAVFLNQADYDLFRWKRCRQVIPNGVDLRPAREARERVDAIKLLAVMRHTPQKDFAALTEYVKLAMRPTDQLTVVGDGPDFEKNRAALCAFGKNVTLLRQTRKMNEIYAAHDVYLLLSKSEGMPLSLLEAMSHGLVPIASAIPGTVDVIEHGSTGFLLQRNRADEIDAWLTDLRNGGALRRVSEAARQRIQDRFTLTTTIEAYMRLIHAVCEVA